jgi:2-hydroxy-3-keto-5-methylthiopentenyl-1-phosphate phosphatase
MEKLIYLYGIIPASGSDAPPLPSFKGLDEESDVYSLPFGNIAAVISELDANDFNEQELEKKTNDAKWLHEKAFHHHEALMQLYQNYPVIPMKFCTIYSGKENLQKTIETHQPKMVELLESIEDKEEWMLKIYCDSNKIKENVASFNHTVEAKKAEVANMSPGRQYLEKRKLNQLIDQEAEKEKNNFSKTIHQKLVDHSINTEVKKNWNRDVTGRQEEMCWNSVYLVEKSKVEDFLSVIKSLQKEWEAKGWYFEATGPWPSYHFAKIS